MSKKLVIISSIVAVVLVVGVGWYVFGSSGTSINLRTTKVERGDLEATISATGTIEPRGGPPDITIQVNGRIIGFGFDPQDGPYTDGLPYATEPKPGHRLVDFGTVVKGGPYMIAESTLKDLEEAKLPDSVLASLRATLLNKEFANREQLAEALNNLTRVQGSAPGLSRKELNRFQQLILSYADNATILAQIDPALYQGPVDHASAMVDAADASVDAAKQTIAADNKALEAAEQKRKQLQALADQYEADYKRVQAAFPQGATASDLDLAKSNYFQGQANLASAAAGVAQADALVKTDQARLKSQQASREAAIADLQIAIMNLRYCTVRAEFDGKIIDRRVNIGQAVVSNQTASSLFLVARDLRRLEVWTSVNEADMANIYKTQKATFTVDAFPGKVFEGTVTQDRENATMQQNVVTYNVVVSTDNPVDKDHPMGILRPYMTANVKFVMAKREKVLIVPNSALRYRPSADVIAPDLRSKFARKAGPKGANDPGAGSGKDKEELPMVWVKDGKYVRPVQVHTGLSDGVSTEVKDGDLEEGAQIVTGESRGADGGDAKSPFAPQLFRR